MRASELEAWALAIADAAVRGNPIEYDRVELKAAWPESPAAAARRLAAHANTAGGDSILWLIGVDEKARQIRGAEPNDLASWWPIVRAQFRGSTPELVRHIVTFHSEQPMIALLFETDRAPYVVLNPASGKPEAGPVELEVPWREGTRTRSARHEDLIRILDPLQRAPSIELLSGRLSASGRDPEDGATGWAAEMRLYVVPATEDRLVIPKHTLRLEVIITDPPRRITPREISMHAFGVPGGHLRSATVHSSVSEVVLDGPGAIVIEAFFATQAATIGAQCEARLRVQFRATRSATRTRLDLSLPLRSRDAAGLSASWDLADPTRAARRRGTGGRDKGTFADESADLASDLE
jgi:hypothetical protein